MLRLALENYADRRREVKAKKSTTKCDEVLPGGLTTVHIIKVSIIGGMAQRMPSLDVWNKQIFLPSKKDFILTCSMVKGPGKFDCN